MSDEIYLYGALTIVALSLFAYLVFLQWRQRELARETMRLKEMVQGGRKQE